MRQRVLCSSGERFCAGEVVERGWMIGPLLERALERCGIRLVVAGCTERLRGEDVLPRRRLVRGVARPAHGEHLRAGLVRTRMSLDERVPDEDNRAGRSVERFAVERERGVPGKNDVHLFVAERRLRVLLDDVVTGLGSDVRVDPEGPDVERPPNRAPEQGAVDHRDGLDLVDQHALPAVGHDGNLAPVSFVPARRPVAHRRGSADWRRNAGGTPAARAPRDRGTRAR